MDIQYLLVRSNDPDEVIRSLNRAFQYYNLSLEPLPHVSDDWVSDPDDRVYRFKPLKGWQRFVVPYLDNLDEEEYYSIFEHLSIDLETYVMYVPLYDSRLWGYVLWRDGEPITLFSSNPFFAEEEVFGKDIDIEDYAGDEQVLARVFNVPTEQIVSYLQPIITDVDADREIYANEGDEHPLNDAHVVFDFMRRLDVPIPRSFGTSPERPEGEYLLV